MTDRLLDRVRKVMTTENTVNDPQKVLDEAAQLRGQGKFSDAIGLHQQLSVDKNIPLQVRIDALKELAIDFLKAGMFDRAEAAYEELADQTEELRIEADKQLLKLYEMTKDWNKAVTMAEELQKITKEQYQSRIAQFYCELAAISLKLKKPEEAEKNVLEALKAEPTSVRARILRGDILKAKGETDAAVKAWQEAVKDSPNLESLVAVKIFPTLALQGKMQEAVGYVLQAAQKDPAILNLAAFMIVKAGKGEDAVSMLKAVPAQGPAANAISALISAVEQTLKRQAAAGKNPLSPTGLSEFKCKECGFRTHSYLWRCPACGAWDTMDLEKK